VLEDLSNVILVFLPANTTSMLQPTDQGLIISLKCHFPKLILLRMIKCTEKKQDDMVTLLDAVRCVEKVCRQAMKKSIPNCFCHAGISSKVQECTDITEKEDDQPLSKWVQKADCGILGQ
jgi:hypothetical protein